MPTTFSVGTMNFGGRTPEAEARRIVERALARGVVDFDTANAYGDGESERIVGAALAGHPEARVATKVGLMRTGGKPEGLAPERVLASARQGRDRLGRPTVDLLYLHAPDRAVPIEETLGAIKDLLADGTIASFGVSNFASWQILEIIHHCRAHGMPAPADSQVLYNVLVRQIEIEYLAFAARYAIRTTVYNPLAGGLLSGKYAADAPLPKGSRLDANRMYRGRYGSPRMIELARWIADVAAGEGLGAIEVAYLWLLDRPGVDRILVGPATVAHLDAALDCRDKRLGEQASKKIDVLVRNFEGTDARYAR